LKWNLDNNIGFYLPILWSYSRIINLVSEDILRNFIKAFMHFSILSWFEKSSRIFVISIITAEEEEINILSKAFRNNFKSYPSSFVYYQIPRKYIFEYLRRRRSMLGNSYLSNNWSCSHIFKNCPCIQARSLYYVI